MTDSRLFGIYHGYDVDGGFGDAVCQEDLLFVSNSKETAEAYAKKWDNSHVYDKPYANLYCGELFVKELPPLCVTAETLDVPPWELAKQLPYCDHSWVEESFLPSCDGKEGNGPSEDGLPKDGDADPC